MDLALVVALVVGGVFLAGGFLSDGSGNGFLGEGSGDDFLGEGGGEGGFCVGTMGGVCR